MAHPKCLLLLMAILGSSSAQQSLDDQLVLAAGQGQFSTVQGLIAKGANPNYIGPQGVTPLIAALHPGDEKSPLGSGSPEIFKFLLAKGANPNWRAQASGYTLLIAAVDCCRIEIVQALLAKGVDVNGQDNEGETALVRAAFAARPAVVQALLAKGADVNKATTGGVTALMAAAYNKQPATAEMLLAKGANPNAQTTTDLMTPLMWAARAGSTEIVKALLARYANPNRRNKDGKTALTLAEDANATEIIKLLRNAGAAL